MCLTACASLKIWLVILLPISHSRGSLVPENTDMPRKPVPCGSVTLLHTDIFPSVTWHNSVCDLKIQNINKREEPGPTVLQAEFSNFPSKWKMPPLELPPGSPVLLA